ncbi:MAG: ATP synthase F1 subunit delta [Mycoplasma sp.]|nr:ATP synthase F1 subunit delta [Mycoplasma sp.]
MEKFLDNYAIAIYEIAEETKKVSSYKKQLSELKKAFVNNPELVKILESLNIERDEKQEVIKKVFKTKIEKNIYNFLFLLIDKKRMQYIVDILNKSIEMFNKKLGIAEGIVYSAKPLKPTEFNQISKKAEAVFGKKIELENLIDESLIAGVKIIVNDEIVNVSMTGKIEQLRNELLRKREQ